jgi:PAS domain S-box-containing protein
MRFLAQGFDLATPDDLERVQAQAEPDRFPPGRREARQTQQLTYVGVDFVSGRLQAADNFAAVMGFALATDKEGNMESDARLAFEHVLADERPRVLAEIKKLLRGTSVGKIHFGVLCGDASQRRIESVWAVQFGPDGRAQKAVVTCLNITPHSETEQTLRESENRYRAALTAGRMGSWETDLVARTRTWSSEGMALFGLMLPQGRGQVGGDADEYVSALHPEDRHLVPGFHRLADECDSFPAEYRIVRPDGTTLWLSGRGLVVARRPDGRAHRLVSIMADVTERRQAEEDLRIERERLAQALKAGQMGVYDLNMKDDVLWWSPQTYAVFGVSAESFKPTRESVAALVHPDDRDDFLRLRAEAIAQHKPFVHEFRVVRPNGTLAWIGHLGQANYDDQGRPVRSFGVAVDITERKDAEHQLRDADRKKDNFIATLAHELRNPLAPIRNAVSLLGKTDHRDPKITWCRDVIDRQVGQMAHLLEDLLDVSRLTRGQFRLRCKPVELAQVIEQAIEIAQPLIGAAGHQLSVSLPADPVSLHGDMTRLAQVFSNLLLNAAKYTHPQGRIQVLAEHRGPEVVVAIIDTGIGIGADQIQHIFGMFGQVESALNRSQGGLGIGLWLARQLVEMHGGQISAHSAGVGMGSEFVVRLPIASTAPTR